jgi:cytochrome c2
MRRIPAIFLGCAISLTMLLCLTGIHAFSDMSLYAMKPPPTPISPPRMEHYSLPFEVDAMLVDEAERTAQPAGQGNPLRGKDLFERRCTGCHSLTENREGPRLQGVYGRTSGEVAGFAYSDALKKAHIVWSDTSLEQWLTDPDTLVPGNEMSFQVPKPQERRDIIEFLQESAGK